VADIAVSQQLLNGADAVAIFQQMRRKGMTHSVRSSRLRDTSPESCILDRFLENRFMEMVPSSFARQSVNVMAGCREHPLPTPLFVARGLAVRIVPDVPIVPVVIGRNLDQRRHSIGFDPDSGISYPLLPPTRYRSVRSAGLGVSVFFFWSDQSLWLIWSLAHVVRRTAPANQAKTVWINRDNGRGAMPVLE